MPQLPSGRHVGLNPSPLVDVLENAYNKWGAHELMAIESINHLFAYIRVLYFKAEQGYGTNGTGYQTFSLVPSDELTPYDSGYNLITIQDEMENWDYCDKKAFIDFLNEKRTNNFLENTLNKVREAQNELLDQPTTLQGMLATWWKLGCHPLQNEE